VFKGQARNIREIGGYLALAICLKGAYAATRDTILAEFSRHLVDYLRRPNPVSSVSTDFFSSSATRLKSKITTAC
jgi:hypothetical protein